MSRVRSFSVRRYGSASRQPPSTFASCARQKEGVCLIVCVDMICVLRVDSSGVDEVVLCAVDVTLYRS